jgi:hypothetical protein
MMRGSHWWSKCVTDAKGKPLPNVANALIALEFDDQLRGALAYEDMAREILRIADDAPARANEHQSCR